MAATFEFKDAGNKLEQLEAAFASASALFGLAVKKTALKDKEVVSLDAGFWDNAEKARTHLKDLNDLKKGVELVEKLGRELGDCRAHLELAREGGDPGELPLIMEELTATEQKLSAFDFELKLSGLHDQADAIISIHSGAGGTEACDWAQMLLRMYTRWAQNKGFSFSITDILQGEEAGIKGVTAFIKGRCAYGYLKSEIGVHRLVRISPFDANKRRHTSFASVDVLADLEEEIDIKIEEKDLHIDTYRSGGAGGQNVNKVETAVRITHMQSGIVVQCQIERSQHQNRETAMKMLKARLYEIEMDKKRSEMERHYDAKGDIGWGHQIRSYVFMPYQMVKDLRTDYETSQIQNVMDGGLDGFMHAYLSWSAASQKNKSQK